MRRILFLDFDGVMHPSPSSDEAYVFCRLELLQAWLRQRPMVEVVISSSWRELYPFEEMRDFFAEDLRPRVVGATPVREVDFWAQATSDRHPVHEREAEIRQWLRANGAAQCPWVAIDDQAQLFSPEFKQLVLCDGRVGLTPRELDLVDEVFENVGKR